MVITQANAASALEMKEMHAFNFKLIAETAALAQKW